MKQAKRTVSRPSALRGTRQRGQVSVPKTFASPGSFSLQGDGVCMEPLISNSDYVVCDPNRKPKPFDLVAVAFKNKKWWVKRYRHAPDVINGNNFFFEQINPTKFYKVPDSHIEAIFVVTYNVTKQEPLIDLPLPEWIDFPIQGLIS